MMSMRGNSCSIVVERTPRDREGVGLIPQGAGLFSPYVLSNVSLNRHFEEEQYYCFSNKNECLALQLGTKQA